MKRTLTNAGWLMLSAGTALMLSGGAMGDTPAPSERAKQITRETEAAARAAAALRQRDPVGSMNEETPSVTEERRIEQTTAYTIKVGKDEYWIVVRGNEIDSVKINGKDAPIERAGIQGNSLAIYNEVGSVTARVRLGGGLVDFPSSSGGLSTSRDAQAKPTRTRMIYPRAVNTDAQKDGKSGQPASQFGAGQGPSTWVVDTNSDNVERSVMVGVQMVPVEPALTGHFGLEPGAGIMISAVAEGLPAAEAGLKPFDIITKIDDKKVDGVNALHDVLVARKAKPGESIKFAVISAGQQKDIMVKLVPFESMKFAGASWKQMPYEPMSMSVTTPTNVAGLFGPSGETDSQPNAVGGLTREQIRRTAEQSLKDAQTKLKGFSGPVVTTWPPDAEAMGEDRAGMPAQQIMILPDTFAQSARSAAIEAERLALLEDRLARMEALLREMAARQAEAMRRMEKAAGASGGTGAPSSTTGSSSTPTPSPKP